MTSAFFFAALLSVCCPIIAEAVLCNGCVNDPPAKCLLWALSPFEVKLMSPFCEGGKLCYIDNDLNYRWKKCVGYCEKTETVPGNYGSGGIKKCQPKTCQCCRPTQLQKVEVCTVCCDHYACSSRQPVSLLPAGPPGQPQGQGQGQGQIKGILSKDEVMKRAKEEYQAKQRQTRPALGRPSRPPPPLPWVAPGSGPTKVPPPSHILPGKSACLPWFRRKVYDVPKACSCQHC